MAPRRVLLLLPTTTYRAADFLAAAARLGIEAVVGSERRQALEEAVPGRSITLDLGAAERAAEQIERFAADHPLAAVIPTDDQTAVVAALAMARLGLPHNPPEAARAARHKDLLRRLLHAAGERTPRFTLVPADADPSAAATALNEYPCVLKPTFLSGSRGVIRADSEAQFAAAFDRIRAILALPEVAEKGGEAARHILVERFVPGAEVAVEGLLTDGRLRVLAIFDKPDPLRGPFFEETIYVTPSRLPDRTIKAITASTASACRAVGLVEGPLHAELRVNDAGAWVIDLAARSIGGLCSRTLRFGAGVSLEELILTHAVGRGVEGLERDPQPAGVMMIPIPRAGTLKATRGLDAARGVAGVVEVTITATIGKPLVPLPEGSAYLGFIFARGATPDAVENALRAAHRLIELEIG